MDRRTLLQALALAATGVLHAKPAVSKLDDSQQKLVTELAELIIPRTETPGAIDAGVPAFIDHIVSDYYTPVERAIFVEGLKSIAAADPARRVAALQSLEQQAASYVPAPGTSVFGKPDERSPFFFKLKAPHNAIGGFGFVARFSRLPDWLAWECFGEGNGAATFSEMEQRLNEIRVRNKFLDAGPVPQIGCILLSQATFLPRDMWIPQPADWSPRNLTYQRYDLDRGEGLRIWRDCQARAISLRSDSIAVAPVFRETGPEYYEAQRYGAPRLVAPRLGQGTFRVAVTDAYSRCCAVTTEHSLPALDAAHIKPFAEDGPHTVSNGLLLRADLHRLFDQGYLTVTPDLKLRVSGRLKIDYQNGHSYYPLDGRYIQLPASGVEHPDRHLLRWHEANKFRV